MIFQEPMTSLDPLYTVGYQIREALELHQKLRGAAARDAAIRALRTSVFPTRSSAWTLIRTRCPAGCVSA